VSLGQLMGAVSNLGPGMFENLTERLYVTFWNLDAADINFPAARWVAVERLRLFACRMVVARRRGQRAAVCRA
jgi:hypothetical protein